MSVDRPPAITLSSVRVLVLGSLFFQHLDALDFLAMCVVLQSLKKEELWSMQLEWVGSYYSDSDYHGA